MRVVDTSDAPALDYVSRADAKSYLRVDHSNDDDLIDDLIQVAADQVSAQANTSWKTRQAHGYLEDWLNADFPVGPLTAIRSVKYKGGSSDSYTTLDSSKYFFKLNTHPARIGFQNYPSLNPDAYERIQIAFDYGYTGPSASPYPTPPQFRQAILMLVSHYYDYRTPVTEARISAVPFNVESLINTIRHL